MIRRQFLACLSLLAASWLPIGRKTASGSSPHGIERQEASGRHRWLITARIDEHRAAATLAEDDDLLPQWLRMCKSFPGAEMRCEYWPRP